MYVCGQLLSCIWLFAAPWTMDYQTPQSVGFPRKNIGVGCHFLLQSILLTQGLNLSLLSLLHWQMDSYHWKNNSKLHWMRHCILIFSDLLLFLIKAKEFNSNDHISRTFWLLFPLQCEHSIHDVIWGPWTKPKAQIAIDLGDLRKIIAKV